jgi:uncharacterized repeat protein (TIGR01451 family)
VGKGGKSLRLRRRQLQRRADGDAEPTPWRDRAALTTIPWLDGQVSAGINTIEIATPSNSLLGETFARFRIGSTGGLSPGGFASDGKVEGYLVEVFEPLDAGIAVTNGAVTAVQGQALTYTMAVTNQSPGVAAGIIVTGTLSPHIVSPTWTATGTPGTTYTASGAGDVLDTVSLPLGGQVTYTIHGTLDPDARGVVTVAGNLGFPAGKADPTPEDSRDADCDLLTVAMHELGHLLGYDHESEGLMAGALKLGARRLPDGERLGSFHEAEATLEDSLESEIADAVFASL